MDVWLWIGLIWVMLGVAVVISIEIAERSVDGDGPLSIHRPGRSLLYSAALVAGAPFITVFALAVCGKVLWEGKIPLSDRAWWQSRAERFDAPRRDTIPIRATFARPCEPFHRSVPTEMFRNDGRQCPKCGAQALPILYGLPSPEAIEAQECGELSLGGCVVRDENMLCRTCGDRWHQGPFIPRLV